MKELFIELVLTQKIYSLVHRRFNALWRVNLLFQRSKKSSRVHFENMFKAYIALVTELAFVRCFSFVVHYFAYYLSFETL